MSDHALPGRGLTRYLFGVITHPHHTILRKLAASAGSVTYLEVGKPFVMLYGGNLISVLEQTFSKRWHIQKGERGQSVGHVNCRCQWELQGF